MGFLDFYSNCFDPKLYGVNTLNEMSFYAQTPQSQHMFVIVDPVNPQNNTARNSHRTTDILKKFHEAFSHLKSLVHAEYLRLQQVAKLQQVGVPFSEPPREEARSRSPVDKGGVATKQEVSGTDLPAEPLGAPASTGVPTVAEREAHTASSAVSGSAAHESLEELSPRLEPLFFASVEFIEHFHRPQEVQTGPSPPGESRPGEAVAPDEQARSGSNASD